MAFSRFNFRFLFIILFCIHISIHSVSCCYETMFTFGDSVTDTGNTISLGYNPCTAKNPYGMTYFYAPNGRYCNGRIIIDYIAKSQGLPYLDPFTGTCRQNFEHGVNFAVGGAPVLSESFYEENHIPEQWAKYSLDVQLGWFKHHLATLCNSTIECKKFLSTSLIFMGEFGGDDYYWTMEGTHSPEIVRTFVPLIVGGITNGVKHCLVPLDDVYPTILMKGKGRGINTESLIDLGAATIVVPGAFPMGCSTRNIILFGGSSRELYDDIGCLIWLNDLAKYHNDLLQKELDRLRKLYTNATIVYADYFKAVIPFYQDPEKFGFNKNPFVACCGEGGKFNVNPSKNCGPISLHICTDPSRFVTWDGVHYTEKVYAFVAEAILSGEILTPSVNISCSAFEQKNTGYFYMK